MGSQPDSTPSSFEIVVVGDHGRLLRDGSFKPARVCKLGGPSPNCGAQSGAVAVTCSSSVACRSACCASTEWFTTEMPIAAAEVAGEAEDRRASLRSAGVSVAKAAARERHVDENRSPIQPARDRTTRPWPGPSVDRIRSSATGNSGQRKAGAD